MSEEKLYRKVIIYDLDNLFGGESGLSRHLSEIGYREESGKIYDGEGVLRARVRDGGGFRVREYCHFGFELQVLDDPILEVFLDTLVARESSSTNTNQK